MSKYGLTTTIVHSERRQNIEYGAVHSPIHTSNQYGFDDVNDLIAVFQGSLKGFSYSRQGTPTTAALETLVDTLEDGLGTVAFSSGMAALAAIFNTMLKQGDHVICSQYIFGNTSSLLANLERFGVAVTMVDPRDLAQVAASLQTNTRLVFTETIANPSTPIADLQALGDFCKQHNLLYVVDNTMTSPYLLKAKTINASLIMHSLSKYICGHSNAMGGSVTNTGLFDWSQYPNIHDDYKKGDPFTWGITQIRKKGLRDQGASISSDAAHRIMIGAETLALRMRRSCDNAMALAQFLQGNPGIVSVKYPGLETHSEHHLASKLFAGKGYGALLAVELRDDIDCIEFLNQLKLVVLATHLGDTRTLALPVAKTIYHEMGPAKRAQMGIADGLLRVSLGIEDTEDLLADFQHALDWCISRL